MFGCLLVRCSYLIVRMAAHFCIPTIATRGVHNDIVRTDCMRHAVFLGSPRSKLKLKHRAMQRCNNSALYQKDQPPPSLNPAIDHHMDLTGFTTFFCLLPANQGSMTAALCPAQHTAGVAACLCIAFT